MTYLGAWTTATNNTRSETLRRAIAVSVLLTGAVACGPTVDNQNQVDGSCQLGNQSYDVGDSFTAPDGCNTCTCEPDGAIACTEIACLTGCDYNGKFYQVGATFGAADGCNTCTCHETGQVSCTAMGCLSNPSTPVPPPTCGGCEYKGVCYPLDEWFPAGDDCNWCLCDTISTTPICTTAWCEDD